MQRLSVQETAALVLLGETLWTLADTHAKACAKLIVTIEDQTFFSDVSELIHEIHDRGMRYMEAFLRVIEYLEMHAPYAVEKFRSQLDEIGYGR